MIVVIVTFVLALCILFAESQLSRKGKDEKEPPTISSSWLPLSSVGHAIQLWRQGSSYFVETSRRCAAPIYTLPLPLGGRIYVVTDAQVASVIQQRKSAFSFDPFVAAAAEQLAGTSKAGMNLVRQGLLSQSGDGILAETHHRLNKMLSSRPVLNAMTADMVASFATEMDRYTTGDVRTVNLSAWIRHTVCVAITTAMYGPMNPFLLDTSLAEAFWSYESAFPLFLVTQFPGIVCYDAYRSREKIVKAFKRYFESGHHAFGSSLIRNAYDYNFRHGVSVADLARWELTTCIGLLTNIIPTMIWTVYHIASSPELYAILREELKAAIRCDTRDETVIALTTLPVRKLRESCPNLASVIKEVLRVYSTSLSARIVMHDTSIAAPRSAGGGTYKLRAGALIQVPATTLHRKSQYWGDDAETFDPLRFSRAGGQQLPSVAAAWRAFGGGETHCPGRHLASEGVLAFVAMFVLQMDVEIMQDTPTKEEDSERKGSNEYVSFTSSVKPGPEHLWARMKKIESWKHTKWTVV